MGKRLFLLCYLFFCLTFVQQAYSQEKITYAMPAAWWNQTWQRADIAVFVKILRLTKTGKSLLTHAFFKDPKFLNKIRLGESSITEANYVRTYSLDSPNEEIHLEEEITLSKYLSRLDAFYDLAHELTHYTIQVHLNPYSMQFNKIDFIRTGIEGDGGELDAFQTECLVAMELESKLLMPKHELCEKYIKRTDKELVFERGKARVDFYAVGNYYEQMEHWHSVLPHLNDEDPKFYSSLEKMPYPVAMLKDYNDTVTMACKNNSKKAKLIAQYSSALHSASNNGRSPQSVKPLQQEQARLEKYFLKFCK